MNAPNFELPASSPESSSRPRVLLVDDNKAFRLAALELLKDMDEIEVCGEAQDAASAMEQVRALHPTLVITDITLPDEDGLYIANRTRELSPQTIV
ncbi:MAG: response regulator transcription factor, partial [Verrucomicrobium sp.]|nr:response regulator [Verrucomicrobium sp.]